MTDVIEVNNDNFLVLSDAHIGASASTFKKDDALLEQIIQDCVGHSHVVLNGDFLDITVNLTDGKRHPRIGGEEAEALERRMDALLPKLRQFLDGLSKLSPQTQVHYVLGNHDGFQRFGQRLQEFAQATPNLHIHDDMLRMGDVLFVHGDRDIPQYTRDQFKAFRQERRLNRGECGPKELAMYQETYSSIAARRHGQADDAPISRIFLGHTHLGTPNIELPEICISNGGVFRDDGIAYIFKGQLTQGALSGLEFNQMIGPQSAIDF